MGGFFGSLGKLFGGSDSGDGLLGSITGLFDQIPSSVATAGIFSAASLVSQMFGRNTDQEQLDLARDKFNQDIINSQNQLALSREELASRERMAGAAAGATVRAAAISAGAQSNIAHRRNVLEQAQTRVSAQEKAAERNFESVKGKPDLIMTGRTAQANQARATGSAGQQAFESLMAGIENGLRR